MPLRELLLPLAIALTASSALAAADCSTLEGNTAGYVSYLPQGGGKKTIINLAEKNNNVAICGVRLVSDRQSYSYQAKNIASLSKLFGGTGTGWPVMMITSRQTDGKPDISLAANLSINFPPETPKGIRIGGSFDGDLSPYSEIVVRVNDGKLQTLLKDVRFTALYFNPKTTKKIDLYAKSPKKLTWTRMLLDIPNAKLTFFRTSTYPNT